MAGKVELAMTFSVDITGEYGARLQKNVFVKYVCSERRQVLRKHGFSVLHWTMED